MELSHLPLAVHIRFTSDQIQVWVKYISKEIFQNYWAIFDKISNSACDSNSEADVMQKVCLIHSTKNLKIISRNLLYLAYLAECLANLD